MADLISREAVQSKIDHWEQQLVEASWDFQQATDFDRKQAYRVRIRVAEVVLDVLRGISSDASQTSPDSVAVSGNERVEVVDKIAAAMSRTLAGADVPWLDLRVLASAALTALDGGAGNEGEVVVSLTREEAGTLTEPRVHTTHEATVRGRARDKVRSAVRASLEEEGQQ